MDTTNSYGPSVEGVCWFRDQNCSQTPYCMYSRTVGRSMAIDCPSRICRNSDVPVGFVGIQMLLFTILLCLLIYNIKNGRMDRRALIDVTLTNCIFFFDHFIIIIFAFASLHYYSSQLITPPTFTFVPITSMLVPLTLLIAIHLPFSSIIARICLKRSPHSHASEECDQTSPHKSSDCNNPVTQCGLPHMGLWVF